MTRLLDRAGPPLVAGLLLASFAVIAFVVPQGQREAGGIAQKIFYGHVSSAWTAFHAFLVALVCGVMTLRTRRPHWDALGVSAVEVGMVFCTLVVCTGPIWARPVWGRYWNMEPRLLSFAIMWFSYAGYLVLRAALAGQSRRDLLCAAYAIVASINVPIVYASVRLVGENDQLHPRSIGLSPAMRGTLWFTVAAFSAWLVLLLVVRYRLERARQQLDARRLAP